MYMPLSQKQDQEDKSIWVNFTAEIAYFGKRERAY